MKQRKNEDPKEEKRPVGRPRVSEEERLIQKALRLNRGQWSTFDDIGGVEWLRAFLDRAQTRSRS